MRFPRAALALATTLATTVAPAFPIRVNTATELVLDPQVSADRHELELSIHLRDDRGAPVDGRRVAVAIRTTGGRTFENDVATDRAGDALVRARIGEFDHQVALDARFAGESRYAPAVVHLDVDLDAPFVTLELSTPPASFEFGRAPPPMSVRVDTGRTTWLPAGGLRVRVAVREAGVAREVAAAVTDPSGSATIQVPASAFAQAGVFELVPQVELRSGHVVAGVGRSVLVHARTGVEAIVVSDPSDAHARIRGALRSSDDRALSGAALRLVRADETVAATRADSRGDFGFDVDLERVQSQGAWVRVRFDPAEPWLLASESAPFRIGEPPSEPVHWWWLVAPWGALAFALVVRRFARRREPAIVPVVPADPRADTVVRAGAAIGRTTEIVVEAFDRATGTILENASWRTADGDLAHASRDSIAWTGRRALVLHVAAPGYESRRVEIARPGPGRHVARVGLLDWREALFDRARPTLARVRADPGTIPTPREAAGDAAWVPIVERGTYGPAAPDASTIAAAESALDAIVRDVHSGVDAPN